MLVPTMKPVRPKYSLVRIYIRLSRPGRAYSILNFAVQARQAKGRFKKCQWTNKCKWSVTISSVNFHHKFAIKFEMREFYESLHSSEVNSQASTCCDPYQCLLASPLRGRYSIDNTKL